jgi:XisH protein
MPARDFYHDVVKLALIADGWTITHDPLVLQWGSKDLFVDLGAERLLAADKGDQKIAVEIKSFTGASDIDDLEKALGQFILYHDILEEREPDRSLYLAVPRKVQDDLFQEPIGELLLKRERVQLLVFDPEAGVIVQWIPS